MVKIEYAPGFNPLPIQYVECCMPVCIEPESRGRNKFLGKQCKSRAKIKIDGKPYCLRHAQQVALNILIEQGKTNEHFGS